MTSIPIFAQSDSTFSKRDSIDFNDMSLEELLNVKVTVASGNELTARESPGIVTVLTEEEIKNSGARDLMELLKLIPGISFHQDVQGVIGIGMRGNWGHEGKVLLIIDEQEMNEVLYSTLNFGNHYDVSSIKQIEVIRGPGSSIYGGYAELGVIKITTREGEEIRGASFTATYGQLNESFARRNISVSAGTKYKNLNISFHGFAGQGQRSAELYEDFYGNSSSMKNRFSADPLYGNIGISYKRLSARLIYDYYQNTSVVWYDEAKEDPVKIMFRNFLGDIKYEWKINHKLSVTPRISFSNQRPWHYKNDEDSSAYKIDARHYTGSIQLNYDLTPRINFLAGVEFFSENATNLVKNTSPYFPHRKDEIFYGNLAGYSQLLLKTNIINITVGARYNYHTAFETAVVPRIGLTKVYKKFHSKLLYSYAYRAPSIENVVSNDDIIPENTQVLELEVGYQLSSRAFLTANAYDINIYDPIVFSVLQTDSASYQEYYENLRQTGTRGIEVELKLKYKWGYLNINYSYTDVAGKNKVDLYELPENPHRMLGFASHTLNMNSSLRITENLYFNPSVNIIGKRGVVSAIDSLGESEYSDLDETVLCNAVFRFKNLIPGLDISAGIYDLFDQKYVYTQPYNSGLAAFSGTGREYMIRMTYYIGKNK